MWQQKWQQRDGTQRDSMERNSLELYRTHRSGFLNPRWVDFLGDGERLHIESTITDIYARLKRSTPLNSLD